MMSIEINSTQLGPLAKLIANSSAISFDVFDTALLRCVAEPADLFGAVEACIRRIYPEHANLDFAKSRVRAEASARELASHSGRHEIQFAEIYDQLALPSGLKSSEVMAEELRLEKKLSRANPYIWAAYNLAIELKKPVVFISDMYLPADFIAELLRRAGYQGRLFLSSEVGLTKSAGGLFEHVRRIADLGDSPLHIGDNLTSDVLNARRAGFRSFHYKRLTEIEAEHHPPPDTLHPSGSVRRSLSQHRLFSNPYQRAESFWYRFGYSQVGILYLGFSLWLKEQLAVGGFEKVFFLARDGHILQRVFDIVSNRRFESRYLYASRRAFNIPAITSIDATTERFLSGGTERLSVAAYLQRIHVDPESVSKQILAAGFSSSDQVVVGRAGSDQLHTLFRSIERVIVNVAEKERRNTLAYLEQEGFFSTSKVAIVDLGWHGTLQDSLIKLVRIAGRASKIVGFYLGTFESARGRSDRGNEMHGYVCENGRPLAHYRTITQCVEFFEFAHTAPHGTVIRFMRNSSGTLHPELAPPEVPPWQIQAADDLQNGGLAFVTDFLQLQSSENWLEVPPSEAIGPLNRVLNRPTREEAKYIGELVHAEGFGADQKIRAFAQPPGWLSLAIHPYRTYDAYHQAFWREGYVTRLVGRDPRVRRILGHLVRAAEKHFGRSR